MRFDSDPRLQSKLPQQHGFTEAAEATVSKNADLCEHRNYTGPLPRQHRNADISFFLSS